MRKTRSGWTPVKKRRVLCGASIGARLTGTPSGTSRARPARVVAVSQTRAPGWRDPSSRRKGATPSASPSEAAWIHACVPPGRSTCPSRSDQSTRSEGDARWRAAGASAPRQGATAR